MPTLQIVPGVLCLEKELLKVRRLEDRLQLRNDDVLLRPLHTVHEHLRIDVRRNKGKKTI